MQTGRRPTRHKCGSTGRPGSDIAKVAAIDTPQGRTRLSVERRGVGNHAGLLGNGDGHRLLRGRLNVEYIGHGRRSVLIAMSASPPNVWLLQLAVKQSASAAEQRVLRFASWYLCRLLWRACTRDGVPAFIVEGRNPARPSALCKREGSLPIWLRSADDGKQAH